MSRIGSTIGKPILADECTTQQSRISYARLLVDVTKPKPETVWVEDPTGHMFKQQIIFDWFPPFCDDCQIVGHKCNPVESWKAPVHRGVKYKKVWQPKHVQHPTTQPVVEAPLHVATPQQHPEPESQRTETATWSEVARRAMARPVSQRTSAPLRVENPYSFLPQDEPILES